MSLLQGIKQILIAGDLHSAHFGQLADISGISRFLDGHGLVRSPCRQHLYAERMLRYIFMVFERIHRIIGGADDFHIEHLHELLASVFR